LVDAIVEEVIIGKIIPSKFLKPFSILSVFRYLNYDLPEEVLKMIDDSRDWSDHMVTGEYIRQLHQETDLVVNSGSHELGYKIDNFIRRSLSLYLRLFFPDDYSKITKYAKTYYEIKYLDKPTVVEFLVEKIFHYIDELRLKYKDNESSVFKLTDVDVARLVEKEFKKDVKPTIADPYYLVSENLVGLFRITEPQDRQIAADKLRDLLSQDVEISNKIGDTSGHVNAFLLKALDECMQESRSGGLGVLEILKHFKSETELFGDEEDSYDVLFRTAKEPMGVSQAFHISPQVKKGIAQDIKASHTREDLMHLGMGLAAQLPSRFSDFLAKHSEPLIIDVNNIDIPWELIHDGRSFISLRIPVGKKIRTVDAPRVDIKNGEKILLIGVSQNPRYDLPALKFVEAELSALSELFERVNLKCDVLLDGDADVWKIQKFIRRGEYKILHFAGHTYHDPANGDGIILADGILRGDVIKNSVRGNPLVFLNTCQSALGDTLYTNQIYRGSFMSGLATDFILGGAKGCIANLWDVKDKDALDFSLNFYKELVSNISVGEALRRAKYEKYNQSDDRSWASYVLFGNPSEQMSFEI